MNLVTRWWKFNLVGILGFMVQMGALACFHRFFGAHYLLASTIALELTLIHNFLWHLRFTWSDRRGVSPLRQFVRFHLSNGLVSFVGNLLIVRTLMRDTRLSLLAANAIAALLCAVANFYFGNAWAFAQRTEEPLRSKANPGMVGPPGLEPGTNGL